MRILAHDGYYLHEKHLPFSQLRTTAGIRLTSAELLPSDGGEASIRYLESRVFSRMRTDSGPITDAQAFTAARKLREFYLTIQPPTEAALDQLQGEQLIVSFWPDGRVKIFVTAKE